MSKSSTATAPKIPTPLPARSAWARGPPQSATTPSPRSQSPAPSTPVLQSHSRRTSALGPGIPIKDGVSIPRNNVGAVKQGSAVTFGSIDDVSAPISSSPAAVPPTKSEGVKTFGSVPVATGHVNGKASISSRPPIVPPAASTSSAASTPVISAAAPTLKPKIDIKKMFQNPSSAPSSNPSSDTSSPSLRNVSLPTQQQQPHQGQSSHPPPNPSQLGAHSFSPFVPNSPMRSSQNNGPNGGPPRSPQYSRQMPNGSGPRSQGGQNGGPPAGLSSPRLGPHPHNSQASTMPPPQPPTQMQPQMQPQIHQPMWAYYQYPPDQQHFMPYQQWYSHMQIPPQHQPPPHQPHPGPQLPHTGMPMSPRNPPSALQGPATPTLSHAIASPVHVPHPPTLTHPSNSLGLTSPPPTPSTPSISGANRLDAGSRTFVPRAAAKAVTVKNADGAEISLESLTKSTPTPSTPVVSSTQSSALRQGSPGTPNRKPASIRMETEDQHKSRLAEQEQKEARLKAEAAEKEKKEKDKAEAERKAKEAEEMRKLEEAEKERIRIEKAEEERKERLRRDEAEKLRTEAEAQELQRLKEEELKLKQKQEEERVLKAKQEQEKQEKALRLAQERAKEEKERKEKEEREEQERLAKVAEENRLRLEEQAVAAAKAKAKAEAIPEPEPEEQEPEFEAQLEGDGKQDGELEDGKNVSIEAPKSKEDGKDKLKDALRINTTSITSDKRRPGPLDLTSAISSSSPAVAALATARVIADIATVQYPEGVNSPHPDLNQNVKNGKFRYDREFLLQFMSVCKERPATLPPLDAIGLEPVDHVHSMSRGGSGRRPSGAVPASRQASIGLGFTPSGFGKPGASNLFSMGNFGTMGPGSKLSSEERYANSNRSASVSGAAGMQYTSGRPGTLQRTASQGGAGAPLQKRVRSKRGENRNENNRVPGGSGAQGHGSGFNSNMNQQMQNLDPVAPLQASENRWDRKAIQVDQDSPELVERKVKGLLNKLTMEKFSSISDQIIAWANKSEKEKDGRTLIQVIRLVFEKATDEATWSEMYARLCRKMMEQISTNVQDDGIKNQDGKPITGGQLFRKYLLNRCQEDFERGWVAKEATAAAAATKALEDEAAKVANAQTKEAGTEEIVLYSDEYYAAQKAKRQGLGLIKFIGELFKLQMLTERIMHECVKKLLGNVDNPEEEEIESLCKLLATVGSMLDTQKARAHLDVYFSRMKELTKSLNVTPRMQYMLQDLLELRERKWVARNAVAAPTTIAQIHENAAKEKAAQEKESYQRQISMSRGGSRRGGDRGDFAQQQVGPDGWAVAGNGSVPRPPPKAGDLSNFGKISKTQPLTFGPSSVFAGKKGAENKREAISRTNSNSNMFSMLSSQGAEASDKDKAVTEPPPQRKRLVLQPRSVPVEATSPAADSESSQSDEEAVVEMTEEAALKKISEDLKEFFSVRNLEEAEVYFSGLPSQHHHLLVEKIVSTAVERKEDDAKLVSQFFALAVSKELCSAISFEQGLLPVAEIIDDLAIDAPKAFQLLAIMVKGTDLDQERLSNLASKSMDCDKFLALLQ